MSKMHIILRAHEDNKNPDANRPLGMTKLEVMRACVRSLGHSIRSVEGHEVVVSVVADRLSPPTLDLIEEHLPVEQVLTGEFGNDESLREAFRLAEQTDDEGWGTCVYMVEDDYLHTEWAISEIIGALNMIQKPFDWIHPTDYPDYYTRDAGFKAKITTGRSVHWRQCRTTTFTFAGHGEQFANLLDPMLETCRHARDGNLSEILRDNGGLACPIPTLAAHWQSERTLPPFPPVPPIFRTGDVLGGWAKLMQQYTR